MYSHDGKRFVNQVLAAKELSLGSHISLGLNIVNGASLDGSSSKTTHNRYHSPYIVDDVPIVNSSVISGDTHDEIVFSGQANTAKRYIANNVALVVNRTSGATRSMRTIANVVNATWTNDIDPANLTRPTTGPMFTSDGVLQLAAGFTASYTEPFSLYGNGLDDIIAFPFYIIDNATTLTTDPTWTGVTVRIRYTIDGVENYCEYYQEVVNASGDWGLNSDALGNYKASLGTIDNPVPFVWQRRISQTSATSPGTTAQTMLDNGKNIIGINVSYAVGNGGSFMRFGSIKLTPDFESDTSRVTVAFRKLASPLYKTDSNVYNNVEYRIAGVVV